MALYKNKYRVESARMKVWNYGLSASYFITICTKNRVSHFGQIDNIKATLNANGLIVEEEWLQTPHIRKDTNLSLSEFVIMPNHFHGIISIGNNKFNTAGPDQIFDATKGDAYKRFGAQSKNLASVIRGFKSAVTKRIRISDLHFSWQGGYHDHIIANEETFAQVKYYILNNPRNWKTDKFYSNDDATTAFH